jgi:hypothetical protein
VPRTLACPRSPGRPEDANEYVVWCRNEVEIWRQVRRVAIDGYDWRIRQHLLREADEFFPSDEDVGARFLQYDDEATRPMGSSGPYEHDAPGHEEATSEEDSEDAVARKQREDPEDAAATKQRDFADTRLRRLTNVLRGDTPDGVPADEALFPTWAEAMTNYRAHPLSKQFVARYSELCDQHSAVWGALAEWLKVDVTTPPIHGRDAPLLLTERFTDELRSAVVLWERLQRNG